MYKRHESDMSGVSRIYNLFEIHIQDVLNVTLNIGEELCFLRCDKIFEDMNEKRIIEVTVMAGYRKNTDL